MHRIVRHFEVDSSRLATRHHRGARSRCRAAATTISDFSTHIETAVERGWIYATLMFGEARVRTGHLMVGMLKTLASRRADGDFAASSEAVKVRR